MLARHPGPPLTLGCTLWGRAEAGHSTVSLDSLSLLSGLFGQQTVTHPGQQRTHGEASGDWLEWLCVCRSL